MVLLSSDSPRKMGFLSCVSHATHETVPLFTHFHPPSTISCSPSQSHSHVFLCADTYTCMCAPLPPLLSHGSPWLQPYFWGPFADTTCAGFMAHSALSPPLPRFSQKLLSSPSSMGSPMWARVFFRIHSFLYFSIEVSKDQDEKEEFSEQE